MTVTELKTILNQYEDNAEVYVDDGVHLHWDLQASKDDDGDLAIEFEENME